MDMVLQRRCTPMSETIQLAVVREHSGKVRCIYLGHLRVFGSKPYVSENLPHEFYNVALSDVEAATRFERKHPEAEAPKAFTKPDGE